MRLKMLTLAASALSACFCVMVAVFCWLAGASSAFAAQSPEEIVAGFDKRVETMFRAESGEPMVREKKQKPLGPGRGNYVRGYSYSMVGFAARCRAVFASESGKPFVPLYTDVPMLLERNQN